MKIGLVLEGGGMRGMYTAGILDTFIDEGIKVDEIVGASAGALFGVNYVSNQKERTIRYNKKYSKDNRYMSIRSLIRTGNYINRDFAFYELPQKLDIFDAETFTKNDKGFYAAVTNVETGCAEYLPFKDVEKDIDVLRASGAIPFISQMVKIDDELYLDGGIADSVPYKFLKDKGYQKIIVILTRDLDYTKKPLPKIALRLLKIKYRKYPKFIEAMENRYQRYNDTIRELKELEQNGEIFVIRPSKPIPIKQLEKDPDHLQEVYDMGIEDAKKVNESLNIYINK